MLCDVSTHYTISHQSSLHKASQDISWVVLVIGDAWQASVEGHHQQSKLEQWAEEAGTTPSKPGLKIELGWKRKRKQCNLYLQTFWTDFSRGSALCKTCHLSCALHCQVNWCFFRQLQPLIKKQKTVKTETASTGYEQKTYWSAQMLVNMLLRETINDIRAVCTGCCSLCICYLEVIKATFTCENTSNQWQCWL